MSLKPSSWSIVKVYRDFENFFDWKRTIKKELANKKSLLNNWRISHTKLYDLYVTVSLDETDALLPEVIKRTKILEILNPLNKYLDEDLGFAGCLTCEFNQFVDDQNNPTLTYLIVYRFNFEKFSLLWLLKFVAIITALVGVVVYFDLITIAIAWISGIV